MHFYFGGNVHPESKFVHNSIQHSKQRCIVVHATHNFLVKQNVACRAYGHCYMTEDGIEKGNRFIENIGSAVHSAIKLINNTMTNDRATVFWTVSPTNDFERNVAAGGSGAGFLFESFDNVRGASTRFQLPGSSTLVPRRQPFGTFRWNVAHTIFDAFMTYPRGMFAPNEQPAQLQDLFAWSVFRGWVSKTGDNQHLTNATFIDSYWRGIEMRNPSGYRIKDVTIVSPVKNTE